MNEETPMSSSPAILQTQNRLLRALPAQAHARLFPGMELVPLTLGHVLYESGDVQNHVYFPIDAIISLMFVTESGASAEIAMIGKEGMVGVPLISDSAAAPNRAIVQSAGSAYRLKGALLKTEFSRAGALQHLLLRYTQTLLTQMSQTAVCYRHHTVSQQLCRLLLMSLDRLPSNKLNMTQELIGNTLGVRRESVTEAAVKLQSVDAIKYVRGRIEVLDRPKLEKEACECYAVVRAEYERLLPDMLVAETQTGADADLPQGNGQSEAINRLIEQLRVSPQDSKALQGSAAAMSLIRVLDQSEQIKIDVEQCAEDLATVNSELKKELGSGPLRPSVEIAIQKSESVEDKVDEAAEDLTSVNQALKTEVKERVVLERELIDVKQQEKATRYASLHDPLTSLPNRGLFDDRLEQALAQAKRNSRTLAVMFIELRERQDTGNSQDSVLNEKVLLSIVSRLENMKRDDDTLTRHGDREFLYLRTELTSETDATAIAEEIIQTLSMPGKVSGTGPALVAGPKPFVGIAVFPRDGATAAALVGSADEARHRAKRTSRGHSFAR